MALFSSIVDEVLPDVPGVTIPLAVRAIRDAVVRACEEAKLVKRYITGQAVTQNEPRVLIPATTGFRLIHLQNMQVDKREVLHASQDDLDIVWRDRDNALRFQVDWHHHEEEGFTETWREFTQDRPRVFFIEKEDTGDFIRFVGIPMRSYTDLQYTKIICPTRDATGIDTWFLERYYKGIAHGAIAMLKSMDKTTWSDPGGAVYHAAEFTKWLTAASRDAATDFNRDDETVGRVQACY